MAAEVLVMLYSYSPLFYISVIAVCFVITAAMVLGWFGFDVPIIQRNSDDVASVSSVPEKKMVQVMNPFALEVGSQSGTLTDGVTLRPGCLEKCVLTCYWGCRVQALQRSLQSHQLGPRLTTPHLFQVAMQSQYDHCQSFLIDKEDGEERLTQMPADVGITDFGPLPRERYPLVALLTLADPDTRDSYDIVASVTVLHVPDNTHRLSARVLFQYLLTAHGSMYELQPLFMSSENESLSGPSDPQPGEEGAEPGSAGAGGEGDEEWTDGRGKDCVVCQNAPVNRVLLPCRHACVCDSCVARFQHCPMCRAFVVESFALLRLPPAAGAEEFDEGTD
ncbi:cell growth regulator with RING finger domain protein 1 [Denticeps clupeoides]|uniref:Cell growth regulator with RING finger domain protein 1 n=1 Tax=Denticeps clupeoides TaxID=299321 RepID=A0AAY4CPC7_9TELE|nr:cell growth regulator with RING finger domain protein 1 [Denticeps clupeoides]